LTPGGSTIIIRHRIQVLPPGQPLKDSLELKLLSTITIPDVTSLSSKTHSELDEKGMRPDIPRNRVVDLPRERNRNENGDARKPGWPESANNNGSEYPCLLAVLIDVALNPAKSLSWLGMAMLSEDSLRKVCCTRFSFPASVVSLASRALKRSSFPCPKNTKPVNAILTNQQPFVAAPQ
jgi:hypothetical protein